MSKEEQSIGSHGENLAQSVLSGMGIEMIEKIGTPIKAIPMGTKNGKPVYQVIWGEKVSGDRRGILPGGKSVLIEVKTILDRNLVWSDLRDHQPERLQIHAAFGGLSLLVWVHNTGVYVMTFPIMGFGKGMGIKVEQAEKLHKLTVDILPHML